MTEQIQECAFNGHRLAISLHDAGGKKIVIFCHGFRGSAIGPHRFFVRAARQLAERGISSLRFDQYGSGNSEGDFRDSSFLDWVQTTRGISKHYLSDGYLTALLGQSMGGAAAIAAAVELPELSAVVAWAPDPNLEPFAPSPDGVMEEAGQVVWDRYWQEAHAVRVADKLPLIKAPTYILQCSEDEYVSPQNREALAERARADQRVETLEGYSHSSWTYEQSKRAIQDSVEFLIEAFQD